MSSYTLPIVDINSNNFANVASIFKEHGFVRIDNVFLESDLLTMQAAMNKIIDGLNMDEHQKSVFSTYDENKHACDKYFLESADKIRFFYEEDAFDSDGNLKVDKFQALNKVGHALHYLNPVFKQYSFSSNIKRIIRVIKFSQPQIVQSMYIFKQPKIGGAVADHIDATFLTVNPIDRLFGIWIAIDEATKENGCLWFIPGSHKIDKIDYRFVRTHSNDPKDPLLKFNGIKPIYDQTRFVPVPVPKGSLVLIDGLVVHKSGPNASVKPRHAYTFHVVDAQNTKWDPDNWLQSTPNYSFPNVYEN